MMNIRAAREDERLGYELWFQSLSRAGRALAFPCNAEGEVDLDALSERSRHNYLYARAVLGRDYGWPVVKRSLLH